MGIKLTKKEKDWILYDVGNSAFTLLVATILPIYFNYMAENAGLSSVDYLAYWGYAASIGTIIVALAGPVLGTMADTRGYKKKLFLSSIIIGVAGCCNSWNCKRLAHISDYLYSGKDWIFGKYYIL